MKVEDYVKVLLELPQDMEVMSMADEFVCYYEAGYPKVKKIRLTHDKYLKESRWEPANFVEDEDVLAEKEVVVV
jgi:hypothetical protein